MGCTCAAEVSDVSNTEDSNLTIDNANALSQENLEVSSENSISEANLVNSHDDNLNDYPKDSLLKVSGESYYEDNGEQKLGLANDIANETVSVSDDDVELGNCVGDSVVSAAEKIMTNITVKNMHYSNTTTFKVKLQDVNGNYLKKQTVSLEVNGKKYTGKTNSKGNTYIKTATLQVGTYDVTLSYAGNSNYSSASLLKKVKISPSLKGTNLNKVYGESKYYSVTFWNDRSVLSNTGVTFYVGDKKYVAKTDSNGVAVLKDDFKPGKYTITAINPVTNENVTNNLVVKKDTIAIKGKSKVYVPVNSKYYYIVTLASSSHAVQKDCKVSFSIANTTFTATTNKDGKASIVIPNLKKGTYDISCKFGGNEYYYSSNSSGKVSIVSPSTKFIASDLKMKYNDGSKFSVTFTDKSGKPLTNKTIKFVLNEKAYYSKTNSKGVATLSIGNLKPGSYKIKYSYSYDSSSDYNFGKSKLVVSKLSVNLTAKNLVMKYNDGSKYKALVKDKSGKAMKGIYVNFKINGKDYKAKTNKNGAAKIKIILPVGYYTVKSTISDSIYTADPVTKRIFVNGTKFSASNKYVISGSSVSFSVKLLDGNNKSVKNVVVKFSMDGKNYNKKTDSKGVAEVNLGVLSDGTHKIKYSYNITKESSKIHVINKVSLDQIIAASQKVKSYVEDNEKLPSSVKIGKLTVSTAEYLYIASKAIINLNSNKTSDISIKKVSNPSKPGSAENVGNLNDYVAVAKSIVSKVNSNGKMPDSVSSSIGTIGYKAAVYAFARVVAFYGDENRMPSYVAITSLSSSSGSTSSLNSKNTISNLAAYLAASTNCQVNNAKIKQLVAKLTDGLTSDKAKAVAIYNYVRDAISYSFYYDTRHGAVGTLEAGSGNCVDHSHLLVAMYRTAGLPARYVHGTCTFSSGTYGHVWTQVLIGDTWIVSDATSARNSFGNVVNWNPSSYSLNGYYASIGF